MTTDSNDESAADLRAAGAEAEIRTHVRIGVTNGLTRDEIAEVIYHASGYAGFPRAVAARTAARQALDT